jgi:hypothetical protein
MTYSAYDECPSWVGSRLLANSYLEQVSWYVVGPISEEQQNQKRRPEAHQINDGHAAIMGDIADRYRQLQFRGVTC